MEQQQESDASVLIIPDAPWPPPSYQSAPPRACCLLDGFPIDGDGYRWPNGKKPNGEFTFDECIFNSPSAALFYLYHYKRDSPHFVTWLHLHCRRDLGILDPIPMAPDPRLLAKYRWNGIGMSKEQFRNYKDSHKLVEKINNLPIDLRVWVHQPQVDYELPFHDTIAGQTILAQQLLRDHQEQRKTIPAILLQDAASSSSSASSTTSTTAETTASTTMTIVNNGMTTAHIPSPVTPPPIIIPQGSFSSSSNATLLHAASQMPFGGLESPLSEDALAPEASPPPRLTKRRSALERDYGSDIDNADEVKTEHPVSPKKTNTKKATSKIVPSNAKKRIRM